MEFLNIKIILRIEIIFWIFFCDISMHDLSFCLKKKLWESKIELLNLN